MRNAKRVISVMLVLALLVTTMMTDGFGAWAADGTATVSDEMTTEETSVTSVWNGLNGEEKLTFCLSNADYKESGATQKPGSRYTEYNYSEKIQLTFADGSKKALKDVWTPGGQYYNMWEYGNSYGQLLTIPISDNTVTKITIPAGTAFPSAAYTGSADWNKSTDGVTGTGEKKGYVTTNAVTFEKSAETATFSSGKDVYVWHQAEKTLLDKVEWLANDTQTFFTVYPSESDYPNVVKNTDNTYDNNSQSIQDVCMKKFNYLDHVVLYNTSGESKTLSELNTGTVYQNLWTRDKCFAIQIKDTSYQNENISKVVFLKGCQIPGWKSEVSTCNDGKSLKAYVLNETLTYKYADNKWTLQELEPTDTEVKNVVTGHNGECMGFFLPDSDWDVCGGTASVNDKYKEYNFSEKIKIYYGDTVLTLQEAYDASESKQKWYSMWTWSNSLTFAIKDIDDATKIEIPKGTVFPAAEYTNNNRQGKGGYKTTKDLVLVKPASTTNFNGNNAYVWEEYTAPTDRDTSVVKIHVRNTKLLLFLSEHDYADVATTTSIGDKLSDYDFLEKIVLSTDTETKTLKDIISGERYYNVWGETGSVAYSLAGGWTGETVKKVTIKKGCEFPSYAYTSGNVDTKVSYVTTEDIPFVANSSQPENTDYSVNYGTKEYETTIEKIHVRDQKLLVFLSENDYAEAGSTKSFADKLTSYDFADNIWLQTENETVCLRDVLEGQAYYNVWGEMGSVSVSLKGGYDGSTIKKISIDKGAGFPSYRYTSGNEKKKITYVAKKSYVYTTNTVNASFNTDWTMVTPRSQETTVTKVENGINGNRIRFTLSNSDYETVKDNYELPDRHKNFDYLKNIRIYSNDTDYVTLQDAYDSKEYSYLNMRTEKNTISINVKADIGNNAVRIVIPADTTFPGYAYISSNQGEKTGYYVTNEVVFEKNEAGTWEDKSYPDTTTSGDVNGDNNVNSTDLVCMAKYLKNGYGYNTSSLTYDAALSDCDNRGNVRKVILGQYLHNYEKESDTMTYFSGSDKSLDDFLNNYFLRHIGYNDYVDGDMKVVSYGIGSYFEGIFNHSWNMESISWMNTSDDFNSDRLEGMKDFTSNKVIVDKYGYVWDGSDSVEETNPDTKPYTCHSMGWPFPNASEKHSSNTTYWEFNSSADSWTSNCNATISNGVLVGAASEASEVIFNVNGSTKLIDTAHAPYLAFDLRMSGVTGNIKDIYVYYTTSSNAAFSTDKMVKVSELAPVTYDYSEATESYAHMIYLPMYTQSGWYNATEEKTYIYGLKIEIIAEDGSTLSGNFGLNYVRPYYDTRYSDNNADYISSVREYYDATGDIEFLKANLTKVRKAVGFYQQMYNQEEQLIDLSYLQGHDGDKSSVYKGISNGYYDVLYTPKYDFAANMLFCAALEDAAYLEEVAEKKNLGVSKSDATIQTAGKGSGTSTAAYNETADTLKTLAATVKDKIQQDFWDTDKGRFFAGYDNSSNKVDYGYLMWNLEAVELGIATEAQAEQITKWATGERTISSDKSTGSDLYSFELAPRVTTVQSNFELVDDNNMFSAWYKESQSLGTLKEFGKDQVQYGGANMYTSYYDLMNRITYSSADTALTRLQVIQKWYEKVEKANESSTNKTASDFYKNYYDTTKYVAQRGGESGVVGIHGEFTESLLMLSAIPKGFFGVKMSGDTLKIAPSLPSTMERWKIENMQFNSVLYDLSIYPDAIRIDSVRGKTEGLNVEVTLDCPSGKSVYVDGVKAENVTVSDKKATLIVELKDTIIEVK